MKKGLFIISLIFISTNLYSQIYMATLSYTNANTNPNPSGCTDDVLLVKIDPQGNISYDCLGFLTSLNSDFTPLSNLNVALNSIINQGYKLIKITDPSISGGASTNSNGGGLLQNSGQAFTVGTVWYFAIP